MEINLLSWLPLVLLAYFTIGFYLCTFVLLRIARGISLKNVKPDEFDAGKVIIYLTCITICLIIFWPIVLIINPGLKNFELI